VSAPGIMDLGVGRSAGGRMARQWVRAREAQNSSATGQQRARWLGAVCVVARLVRRAAEGLAAALTLFGACVLLSCPAEAGAEAVACQCRASSHHIRKHPRRQPCSSPCCSHEAPHAAVRGGCNVGLGCRWRRRAVCPSRTWPSGWGWTNDSSVS
jgi:hypothetical protein